MGEVVVTVDHSGQRATVTWSNPRQRNALTPEILDELTDIITQMEADQSVRALVLSGDGDCFSAGYAMDRVDRSGLGVGQDVERLCRRIETTDLVVIARIVGYAVGAALDVAAACDFRFATGDSKLGITPAKFGLLYSWQGVARVHRLVGGDWARRLFLTAALIDGAEAETIGLVTTAVPTKQHLDREIDAFVEQLLSSSARSVSGFKALFEVLERYQPDSTTVSSLDKDRAEAVRELASSAAARRFLGVQTEPMNHE